MRADSLQEFGVIAAVAENLFPESVDVTAHAYEVPPVERYWLIPGNEGLRWIIPVDAACGWPVLKQWTPYNRASRLKWTGLMAAYRTGCLGGVPRVQLKRAIGIPDRQLELAESAPNRPDRRQQFGVVGQTLRGNGHLGQGTLVVPMATVMVEPQGQVCLGKIGCQIQRAIDRAFGRVDAVLGRVEA